MLDANPREAVIRREPLAKMGAALAELPEYHRRMILLREELTKCEPLFLFGQSFGGGTRVLGVRIGEGCG